MPTLCFHQCTPLFTAYRRDIKSIKIICKYTLYRVVKGRRHVHESIMMIARILVRTRAHARHL